MDASCFDVTAKEVTIRGKGDKTRTVPVSDTAWTYIIHTWVKSNQTGNSKFFKFQDRTARRMITQMGQKVGLARSISSHDLRATFATSIYHATHDLRAVQELLGHSSIATTEAYLGISREQLRSAVSSI